MSKILFMNGQLRMYSVENSNTFLAYYNQLDKYFAYVLGLTKYMPFTEKVGMLAEGRYLISSFVKIYQNKLRYFGDLRNQLVHGFRLDNQHYVLASDHAIGEVKSLYEEARSPKTAFSVFAKKVYTCKTTDGLKQVISTMKKEANTHVPVYDEQGKFIDMLSESTITYWIADEIDAKGEAHLEQITVGDVPLGNSNEYHLFVDKEKSVYEIEELFAEEHKESEGKKRLGAVFITATASESEPIEGVLTAMDLPKLSEHFVL